VLIGSLTFPQCFVFAQAQPNQKNEKKWNFTLGWHGVVPGKSLLKDAEAKLGPGNFLAIKDGLKLYQFSKGVEIVVNPATLIVADIKVTDAVCPDPQFPTTAKAAQEKYGPHGFESLGVRPTYSKGPEPHLTALEFVEVRIVDDTPMFPPGKYH
jgi:hypothetical protein